MEVSAGKFIDYTDVLWLDIILNAVFIANVIGLSLWVSWGFKERRQGVRGAVRKAFEKAGHANGWKPRTRWTLAGVALAGDVTLMVIGAVLLTAADHGGGVTLGWGIAYAALWLLAIPLCRPVGGPRPPHSKDWAESDDGGSSRTDR
ncbi:hypothetical protein [Streptomyces sp. NPDC002564]|uniref:hypothetical protein n=1 Tax=Streptomyces sp. NPDC002564 TaxID=3364649 RepID=UPI0036C041D0